MKRREFIGLLGGAAAAGPIMTVAGRAATIPTIGFLGSGTLASHGHWLAAFLQRLGELGWRDGHNLKIEYRWAEGSRDRAAEFAAAFVRLRVDVIVTYAHPMALAAKQATAVIPIVFAALADPVGTGLVESLSRPGGNLTGLSAQNTDLAGKRLELSREVVPGLRRLAVMANLSNPGSAAEKDDIQKVAPSLGIEAVTVDIQRPENIAPALAELKGRVQALHVCIDALLFTNRASIIASALEARLPTMVGSRELVADGGLLTYVANFPDLFRRAGDYVDKILRGAKPSDLPIEQPRKFDLIINMKTAKSLGLTIPPSILARADEVIE